MIAKIPGHVRIFSSARIDHLATSPNGAWRPDTDWQPICGQRAARFIYCDDMPESGARLCHRCKVLAGRDI